MKQPENDKAADLLKSVIDTPSADISEGIAKKEGLNGSAIEPVYSQRRVKCYSITESELMHIDLANIGITAFFAIGSAFFAFALDLFKDTLFANPMPEAALSVISYLQPIMIFVGILFWIFGGIGWWWRVRIIDLIKKESAHN